MRPKVRKIVLIVIVMLACVYPVYPALSGSHVGDEAEGEKSFLPAGYPEHGILINIPARRLIVVDQGRVAGTYPVAVGRPDSPTPVGDFTVATRIWQPWWYPRGREPVPAGPDNPLGPWWLGLTVPGYGIHGNNNESSIGQFISDGCIRMSNEDVLEVAQWARIGTPVRMVYDTIALIPRLVEDEVHWSLAAHLDVYRRVNASPEDLVMQLRRLLTENNLHLSYPDEVEVLRVLAEGDFPIEVPAMASFSSEDSGWENHHLAVFFGDDLLGKVALRVEGEVHLPLGAMLRKMGGVRGTTFTVEFDFRPGDWHTLGSDGSVEAGFLLEQAPPSFEVNIVESRTGAYNGLTAFVWEDVVYVPASEIGEHFRVTVFDDEHSVRVSWRELYLRSYLLAVFEDPPDVEASLVPADVIRGVFGRRILWDEHQREALFMGRILQQVLWTGEEASSPWVSLEEIVEILGLKLLIEGRTLRMVS